ncbi:MAG TPA: GNAT family N-acetyltransferase [Gaiellaceae bacterium]|nr:GNAT family N-acetyltransferase [Gaiellaceae bacterium]
MNVRPADWSRDADGIRAIGTSFTTDRVYRFGRAKSGFEFALPLVTCAPLTKSYPLPDADPGDGAFVAESDGAIVGFAQVEPPTWNGRAVVPALHVAPEHRGRGVGRALVDALVAHAREAQARCLFVETQNVNYPAVQFYLATGFYLCGLDKSFYDPTELPGEFALFFARTP